MAWIQTGSSIIFLPYTLEQALRGLAAAGFENVEIGAVKGFLEHLDPDAIDGEAIASCRRLLAENGLACVSMSGHAQLHTEEGKRRLTNVLRAGKELGITVLNTFTGDAESPEELKKFARAGYAIPFMFPPVRIRGDWFVDGGFAWNIPLEHALRMGATEIYVLTVIAHELPYQKRFRTIAGYAGRFMDVMWRTLGNVGYFYTPIEDGKIQGVPVTLIQPGEELSGLPMFDLFNVHPKKSRRLMDFGYRDAKRLLSRGRAGAKRIAARAREEMAEQAGRDGPRPRRASGRRRRGA